MIRNMAFSAITRGNNNVLMLVPAQVINRSIHYNSSHPSLEGSFSCEMTDCSKHLDQTFLQHVFSLIAVFGVTKAYTHHFVIEPLVKRLLAGTVLPYTTSDEFVFSHVREKCPLSFTYSRRQKVAEVA